MDLEVVGRHALLFDDDSAAEFVNSRDALVEWNSLFIDRYDVRHLLSSPPPPRMFARRDLASQSGGALKLEIERERFLDLPLPPCEDEDPEVEGKVDGRGFRAVTFSYGNGDENNEQKVSDAYAGFRPAFPLPESLLQNLVGLEWQNKCLAGSVMVASLPCEAYLRRVFLDHPNGYPDFVRFHVPTTDKVHQIIARTALFVREHGGQSEIVLRVKHGDNPAFGFLMPDHQLHPYFRFLIDHPEVLSSDHNGKSSEADNGVESGPASAGGVLSLLGATYGSGEDEDVLVETKLESDECKSNVTVGDSVSGGSGNGEPLEVAAVNAKQILGSHSSSSSKDKAAMIKKNRSSVAVKSGGEIANKRKGAATNTAVGNAKSSGVVGMKVEQRIVEPPTDVKRLIDKIVEFIAKNGKEFEAVLVEQDKNYGRFSFLLPSSHYHPYYLAVLNKAEKSKLTGRKSSPEKDDLMFNGDEKTENSPPLGSDIPYESDRKGKFKMIISRTKKDGHEQLSKEPQQQIGVGVDVNAAAAILQAVRKGIKNPKLDIFQKASQECGSCGISREDRESTSVSSNKVNSKAAAAAAAEADSAETHLTREETLKADRLRRAKMFTAMLKSGAAPLKTQLSHGSSLDTPNSEVSGVSAVANFIILGTEGGSDAINVSVPDNVRKLDRKVWVDEQIEWRSRRRYRSRAETHEDESAYEDEEDEGGDKFKEMDRKHSKKKRSHCSSRHGRERHKHRKGHLSSKDGEPQRRHRHKSSDDELHDSDRHRHESLSDDADRSRSCRHNHHGSQDDEHGESRRLSHRRKHVDSSDDDGGHDGGGHRKHRNLEARCHKESDKRERKSRRSGRELEGGEIEKARDNAGIGRGMSGDLTAASLGQPSYATADENDFRAKIRAILMSTM